jgi:hypothetical protein
VDHSLPIVTTIRTAEVFGSSISVHHVDLSCNAAPIATRVHDTAMPSSSRMWLRGKPIRSKFASFHQHQSSGLLFTACNNTIVNNTTHCYRILITAHCYDPLAVRLGANQPSCFATAPSTRPLKHHIFPQNVRRVCATCSLDHRKTLCFFAFNTATLAKRRDILHTPAISSVTRCDHHCTQLLARLVYIHAASCAILNTCANFHVRLLTPHDPFRQSGGPGRCS